MILSIPRRKTFYFECFSRFSHNLIWIKQTLKPFFSFMSLLNYIDKFLFDELKKELMNERAKNNGILLNKTLQGKFYSCTAISPARYSFREYFEMKYPKVLKWNSSEDNAWILCFFVQYLVHINRMYKFKLNGAVLWIYVDGQFGLYMNRMSERSIHRQCTCGGECLILITNGFESANQSPLYSSSWNWKNLTFIRL